MDNKSYEQYKAQQPQASNVELRKSYAELDPWDGHLSNTELSVLVVIAVLLGYALFKLFKKDNN